MTFSTSSFLAGVGTVFAAVTIGFAGGAMITTSPKMEQNRVERVASHTPPAENAPVPTPAPVAAKAETPANSPAPTTAEPTQTSPARTERVIAITPASAAPQSVATQASAPSAPVSNTPSTSGAQQVSPARSQPVTARDDRDDDNGSQVDRARKVREGEPRKGKEFRPQRVERRATDPRNYEARNSERRKRQEIDAAADAVRQMKRDGALESVRSARKRRARWHRISSCSAMAND